MRIGTLWEPTDQFSLNFKAEYNYLDLSAYPADPILATNDPFELTANADMHALDRFGRAVLKLDYEFANGTTLRSVSGYQQGQTEYRTDLDGTSAGDFTFGDIANEDIYSEEINLISSDANKFKWIVGAYYQHDKSYFRPDGGFYIGVPPPVFYLLDGTNIRETWAVFGQMSFDLPAGFELQVGARYTDHTTVQRHQHQPVRPAAHAAAGGGRSRTSRARWGSTGRSTITTSCTPSPPRASVRAV